MGDRPGHVSLAVSLAVLQGPTELEGMTGLWLDMFLETCSMYLCPLQLEDMAMSSLKPSPTEPCSGRVYITMQHTSGT